MNTPEKNIPTEAEVKETITSLQERVDKLNANIESGLIEQKEISVEAEKLLKDGEVADEAIQKAQQTAGSELAQAAETLDKDLEEIEKSA